MQSATFDMKAHWRRPRKTTTSPVLIASPFREAQDEFDSHSEIAIIFTSVEPTISAIEYTAALLEGLHFRMSLVWPQPVPYVLPLEEPAISAEFGKTVLLNLAQLSPSTTRVRLCFCRHRLEALTSLISPQSPIVIGIRKSLWPVWGNEARS